MWHGWKLYIEIENEVWQRHKARWVQLLKIFFVVWIQFSRALCKINLFNGIEREGGKKIPPKDQIPVKQTKAWILLFTVRWWKTSQKKSSRPNISDMYRISVRSLYGNM